jgi:ubiquinol-cytochrome c reductase iron-sulfur subunit
MVDRRQILALPLSGIVLQACSTNKMGPGTGESDVVLEIPFDDVEPGGWIRVRLAGNTLHIRRRDEKQIQAAREGSCADLISPEPDSARAIVPEWLVVKAECTHEKCEPSPGLGTCEGWRCMCHGAEYDLSGRVTKGPARRNLPALSYDIKGRALIIRAESII